MKIKTTVEKYTWDPEFFCMEVSFIDLKIKLSAEEAKQKIKILWKNWLCTWIMAIIFVGSCIYGIGWQSEYSLVGIAADLLLLFLFIRADSSWEVDKKYKEWEDNLFDNSDQYLPIKNHNEIEMAKKKEWEDANSLTVSVHNYCKYHNIRDLVDIMDYLKKEGVIKEDGK